jgi:hypothetical protein
VVDPEGFLYQRPFAVVIAALELDLEGFAVDAQGIGEVSERSHALTPQSQGLTPTMVEGSCLRPAAQRHRKGIPKPTLRARDGSWSEQGCIKRMALCNDRGLSPWLFSIVLVLAVVLERKRRKTEHEDEDDDEGDRQSTQPILVRNLGSIGQSELDAALWSEL